MGYLCWLATIHGPDWLIYSKPWRRFVLPRAVYYSEG